MRFEERVSDLLYSCEDREELCRRVVRLQDLVAEYQLSCACDGLCAHARGDGGCELLDRAMELGVDG